MLTALFFRMNADSWYCRCPLSYLGMCAFASRSFSVDRGRPFGQWGLLGLAVSCDVILWLLPPSFPPCVASLSFSFAPSFGRPLCSAKRMSKCFLRPGTARRWVKEWVWSGQKKKNTYTYTQKKVNSSFIPVLLRANKHQTPQGYFQGDLVNESIDLWRIHSVAQT